MSLSYFAVTYFRGNEIVDSLGLPSTCLAVYVDGGAPAVFRSPKCPRWTLSSSDSHSVSSSVVCESAVLQGRRKSQEDRALCTFDLRVPFLGPTGVKEVNAGIMAIFDGHNGSEASEMASELLLEYFVLHTYFLLDSIYSTLSRKLIERLPNKGGNGLGSFEMDWDEELDHQPFNSRRIKLSSIVDGSFPFELLKEALLRAINDIDAAFSEAAYRYGLNSGTTATVVLMADTQILVANVGDSKAFLCTEVYQSPSEAKATVSRLLRQRRIDGVSSSVKEYQSFKSIASKGWMYLVSRELTEDHHPDRDDEKSRIESAGGYISDWAGVARVNGDLAVSRAIGDVHFKSFGVIPVPEVTDWQPLTINTSFVVAASDGVFEKLRSQDICDILWEPVSNLTRRGPSSCSFSSAECIVNAAFDRGSMDNLAAIVIPIQGRDSFIEEKGYAHLAAKHYYRNFSRSIDDNTSALVELKPHSVVSKLDRLLVEGKRSNFGCFYLSENLDVNDDYTFWIHEDDQEFISDLSHALSKPDHFSWSGPLYGNADQCTCLYLGSYKDEDDDRCIISDGFARFLGLLQSVPFHNAGQNDRATLYTRYILKKKFDRGAFGEVWLAFHWNCTQVTSDLKGKNPGEKFIHTNDHIHADNGHSEKSFYTEDCRIGYSNENMFILKRIMVERGLSAYLSGLREKYFGEIFLNASTSLKVPSSFGDPKAFSHIPHCVGNDSKNIIDSVEDINWKPSSSEDKLSSESGWHSTSLYEEGLSNIARYVESFESQSNEIWLVFRHEGVSLSKFLYTAEEVVTVSDGKRSDHGKRVQILHPSKWWHWLKTTESGQEAFRSIIWQLLMGLKACHDRGITHRDVKPGKKRCFRVHCRVFSEFLMDSGSCLRGIPNSDDNYITKLRIIDFGSAVNDFTVKHLYGSTGPSSAEQTLDYAPPEASLNATWYQGPASVTSKYDMWSAGVVIMELILGSPHVFQISSKTQALLEQHLNGWADSLKELAYRLRALMEMCILLPGISSELQKNDKGFSPPVPWKCSVEHFSNLIKSRDPLKIGFPNTQALRLVRDLLQWDPAKRLSVDEALRHPYFSTSS